MVTRRVLASVLILTLAAGACGKTSQVSLQPVSDASGHYWKDISGTDYDAEFRAGHTYDNASVSLSYSKKSKKHFRAHLTAEGLKPNFCYQVKLEGKPWAQWVYRGDDAANEALGYAGRWWRIEPKLGESSDEEYGIHKDDEAYIFNGFLLVDFFVTDDSGSASVDLVSDSSFRELWRLDQRTRQADDGPIRDYEVAGRTVGVYAQREPGRADPGELVLPPGSYSVQLSLTEESFHDPGGRWAKVMAADEVSFEIEPRG